MPLPPAVPDDDDACVPPCLLVLVLVLVLMLAKPMPKASHSASVVVGDPAPACLRPPPLLADEFDVTTSLSFRPALIVSALSLRLESDPQLKEEEEEEDPKLEKLLLLLFPKLAHDDDDDDEEPNANVGTGSSTSNLGANAHHKGRRGGHWQGAKQAGDEQHYFGRG